MSPRPEEAHIAHAAGEAKATDVAMARTDAENEMAALEADLQQSATDSGVTIPVAVGTAPASDMRSTAWTEAEEEMIA